MTATEGNRSRAKPIGCALTACLATLLTGCPFVYRSQPVANMVNRLSDLNSEYDEYNAYAPSLINETLEIIYSTNRGSAGSHFAVWKAAITLKQEGRRLNISARSEGPFLEQFDTPGNELGPLLHSEASGPGGASVDQLLNVELEPMYLFAGDHSRDDYDIYYSTYDESGWAPLLALGANSSDNEAYVTFGSDALFFASDRGQSWDIYRVSYAGADILDALATGGTAAPVSALNSAQADTCPYVHTHWYTGDKTIVFCSDRDGGLGGSDIYYAHYDNATQTWSEPKSIGTAINSPYNEYRPTLYVAFTLEPIHWLLLFSSDRPGGQGGYDLYLAVFGELPFDS